MLCCRCGIYRIQSLIYSFHVHYTLCSTIFNLKSNRCSTKFFWGRKSNTLALPIPYLPSHTHAYKRAAEKKKFVRIRGAKNQYLCSLREHFIKYEIMASIEMWTLHQLPHTKYNKIVQLSRTTMGCETAVASTMVPVSYAMACIDSVHCQSIVVFARILIMTIM